MSKTKSAIHASNAGIVFRPAPQVVAMATAAVGRLEKLLIICDFQIEALGEKSASAKDFPHRELLTLARMVLNLQKDLDKYAAIAYPSTKEFPSPSNAEKPLGKIHSDSNKEVDRDSINDGIETIAATTIEITSNKQSLMTQGSTSPRYASQPQYSGNLYSEATSPSYGITLQEEEILFNGKKSSKNQKFSHSFFQNRTSKTKNAT